MKIALITRTENRNYSKELSDLIRVAKSSGIRDRYVVLELGDSSLRKDRVASISVELVHSENPTGPASINMALKRMEEDKKVPDAFLICSQEVELGKEDIDKLKKELKEKKGEPSLLVVGFKFKIEDDELDRELQDYYNNKELIAYRVPWNTCALWNYELFRDYVGEFDKVTDKKPYELVPVCIDNVCHQTEQKGMEDGLAIAKAASQSASRRKKVSFELLNGKLPWRPRIDNYKDRLKHRKKLARKDFVMRNFMADRGYPEEDLLLAEKVSPEYICGRTS